MELENRTVIGWKVEETPPSQRYVNKHTLSMRHWNNGGQSSVLGLMMYAFLLPVI